MLSRYVCFCWCGSVCGLLVWLLVIDLFFTFVWVLFDCGEIVFVVLLFICLVLMVVSFAVIWFCFVTFCFRLFVFAYVLLLMF